MKVMDLVKNFINSTFRPFNLAIYILLSIAIILFSIITYNIISNTLTNFNARAYSRAQVIENTVYSSISDANQIIYGLVMMLTQEPVSVDNQYMSKLLKSFDSRLDRYKSIPFSCLKLLDRDDMVIATTTVPDNFFMTQKDADDLVILRKSKEKPFELQVGLIRIATRCKEDIIPMCMSFSSLDGTHMGALCSGLLVSKLNDKLNLEGSSKNIVKITLKNDDKISAATDHYEVSNIFTMANLPTLLQYAFQERNLIVHVHLNNYPLLVKIEVNLHYLIMEIGIIFLLSVGYFILFIAFAYYLFVIYEKFYEIPLCIIQKKLYELPEDILPINRELIQCSQLSSSYFSMQSLIKILDEIINHLNDSYLLSKQEALTRPAIALRNNILDLVLTEHHYAKASKNNKLKFSSLCLNRLKKIVIEERVTDNLLEFLKNVAAYCSEYYDELCVDVVVQKKDCKDFTFYYTALVEVIFHILTLIVRVGKFDIDSENIILRGSFAKKNFFPTLSIEVPICDSSLKPFGWESGPNYIYAGLLTIYLLAKENNLIFHIEQKGQKITFILEPVNNEQLQTVDSISMSLT